jgi:RNA polymerase sigma-70 factor (ECF subfamily)
LSQAKDERADETSKSLIQRVRSNDAAAWDTLCGIYGPLVYEWARKSGLKKHDSEDIVQEVFRRVATRVGDFEHGNRNSTFRGWLWTICRNAITDRYRKLAGDLAQAEGGSIALQRVQNAPDWIDNEDASEPELSSKQEAALLRRALKLVEKDFAAHTWKAFWDFTIEGHSAKDVAQEIGMSESGVRQAKFRVLARLKEELGTF